MKPKVNQEICIGCGNCVSVIPEVFEIGTDGKSHVKELKDYSQYKDKINEAVGSCPVQAISIEDEN